MDMDGLTGPPPQTSEAFAVGRARENGAERTPGEGGRSKAEFLRARKRALLARKKYELDLQAQGLGDNLALYMVNEELLDVNDHLRALTAGRRRRSGSATASSITLDRQQYQSWRQADTALDDEIAEGRAAMGRGALEGLERLPPRQRETLERYLDGGNIPQIAAALGVHKSTVSRTLARARRRLRNEAERAGDRARLLREGGRSVDLGDPAAAKAVLLAMTPKQTAYFYLYYSECLTLREIGELTGTDHAAIFRTLRRALRNIGRLLGTEGEAVLERPEALEALAWQAYCHLESHPELMPEGAPRPVPYRPRADRPRRAAPQPPPPPAVSVRVRRSAEKPTGRLLEALLARRRDRAGFPVLDWLAAAFTALRKCLKRKGKEIRT